jgi:serine/threonine protein kinase
MPLDARSDVFSFGSVLYKILTGKQPFQAQYQAALLSAILADDPKPLGEERRDIPPELRRIVTRCLKKDPQRDIHPPPNSRLNSRIAANSCFLNPARFSPRRGLPAK